MPQPLDVDDGVARQRHQTRHTLGPPGRGDARGQTASVVPGEDHGLEAQRRREARPEVTLRFPLSVMGQDRDHQVVDHVPGELLVAGSGEAAVRVSCPWVSRPGGRAGPFGPVRKVRAPQGRVVGNADPG
jgi:hypothetical protein